MNKKMFLLSGLIFVLLFMRIVNATVLIPKNFESLTREAEVVFIGTVTDIRSEWRDDRKLDIYTYITFSELEIIEGNHSDSTLVVRISGGEIDQYKSIYAGIPKFKVGETNLIFLAGNNQELCPIVGWIQGRFHVIYDDILNEEVILTDDKKRITRIDGNNIVVARERDDFAKSSPGTPDNPQGVEDFTNTSRVALTVMPDNAMTLKAFASNVQQLRNKMRFRGESIGYQRARRVNNSGIPVDALQPQQESKVQRIPISEFSVDPRPNEIPLQMGD